MHSKDADAIANSVDPDQTAPLGAVWSGSALFAQIYLSENLGSLIRYYQCPNVLGLLRCCLEISPYHKNPNNFDIDDPLMS